jgi:hypothetical protein
LQHEHGIYREVMARTGPVDSRSAITPAAAMRARDVSRPSQADLAAAEAEVEVSYRERKDLSARQVAIATPAADKSAQERSSGRGGS